MALIGAVNEQRTARGWLAADLAEAVCGIRARSAAKARPGRTARSRVDVGSVQHELAGPSGAKPPLASSAAPVKSYGVRL